MGPGSLVCLWHCCADKECTDNEGRLYLLVHIRINVANEEIRPNIRSLLVLAGLIDPDGLAIHLDHIQHLDGLRIRHIMLVPISIHSFRERRQAASAPCHGSEQCEHLP